MRPTACLARNQRIDPAQLTGFVVLIHQINAQVSLQPVSNFRVVLFNLQRSDVGDHIIDVLLTGRVVSRIERLKTGSPDRQSNHVWAA